MYWWRCRQLVALLTCVRDGVTPTEHTAHWYQCVLRLLCVFGGCSNSQHVFCTTVRGQGTMLLWLSLCRKYPHRGRGTGMLTHTREVTVLGLPAWCG